MSKAAAIDYAVRRQLALDGKPQPRTYREIMKGQPNPNDPNDYMGYDQTSILSFLVEVGNQLRLDEPPRTCLWATLDLQRCLDATVKDIEALIAAVTS